MRICLETPHLIIRDHNDKDIISHHNLLSNKKVMYYTPEIYSSDYQNSLENLQNSIKEVDCVNRKLYYFRIELKETGEHIGEIGYDVVLDTSVGKVVHVGYFLYDRFWNRGYATEALSELIRFAFEENNVFRISTGCLKENVASEKVMIKCGMIKEAEKLMCEWHDSKMKTRVEYRLLKEEWSVIVIQKIVCLNTIINGIKNDNINDVVDEVYELEQKAWDISMAATKEKITKRLELFPEGLWRIYHNSKLCAYLFFLKVDLSIISKYNTWNEFSANGTCATYSKNGDALFGVTICSVEKGKGKELFKYVVHQITNGYYGVKKIFLCSRIPLLSKVFDRKERISAEDLDIELIRRDKVVHMVLCEGFRIEQITADGYEIDEESYGYSAFAVKDI